MQRKDYEVLNLNDVLTEYYDGKLSAENAIDRIKHFVQPTLIQFELGDVVFCPSYNVKGILIKFNFNLNHGRLYYHIQNPLTGVITISNISNNSYNSLTPTYLQLICKKRDYELIAQNHLFGYPDPNKK
jgi:hypothetical protein